MDTKAIVRKYLVARNTNAELLRWAHQQVLSTSRYAVGKDKHLSLAEVEGEARLLNWQSTGSTKAQTVDVQRDGSIIYAATQVRGISHRPYQDRRSPYLFLLIICYSVIVKKDASMHAAQDKPWAELKMNSKKKSGDNINPTNALPALLCAIAQTAVANQCRRRRRVVTFVRNLLQVLLINRDVACPFMVAEESLPDAFSHLKFII